MGQVLLFLILNILQSVFSVEVDVEVKAGTEVWRLFNASDQENCNLLQDPIGLHWNINLFCNDSLASKDYINVMLDDGDQTKSFRLTKTLEIDIFPVTKLSENSSLSLILETRSEKLLHVAVSVTIDNWFQDPSNDTNVLETFIDKPSPSSPAIKYFYTYNTFNNDSQDSSWSIMSIIPSLSYLLVNLEQSAPYDCYVASLQDAMADAGQLR